MVTLGMVAAISGVGGLLAANPPSWATADEPVAQTQQAIAQRVAARQETAGQGEAREAAVRTTTTRQESGQAAQPERASRRAGADQTSNEQAGRRQAVYSAEPQTSASASASASAAAPASASASAVSQGS